MMKEIINTKELTNYKKEISAVEKYSEALIIENQKDYESALGRGKEIKDTLSTITDRRKEITAPMNTALKSVMDLFRPLETAGASALSVIKDKMLEWTTEETRKAEKAKLKIAKKLEEGKISLGVAVKQIEKVKEIKKTVNTENGSSTTRTVKKIRIVNELKIPRDYLIPNLEKIKE